MKYFAFFFLLITFNCKSQTNDCSKFKTGTFEYSDSNIKYIIVRTDSTQIESNKENNFKIISDLKWTSDCEYVLTYKDIINYSNKDQLIGKKIIVTVIKINDNTFTVHAKSDVIDSQIEFIKINE